VESDRQIGSDLTVSFLDQVRVVHPSGELVFGRGVELDIDDNALLHRTVGRFLHRDGIWWLQNLGTRIELSVSSTSSRWSTLLPPGTQTALVMPVSIVRFGAGAARYELTATGQGTPADFDVPLAPDLERTLPPESVRLGTEHRALLAALCERRLVGTDRDRELPSSQEIAERLGWTLKKVSRKIDWTCAQYAELGVPGLRGSDSRTNERRRRLVDHVLQTGEINETDLALIDVVTKASATGTRIQRAPRSTR